MSARRPAPGPENGRRAFCRHLLACAASLAAALVQLSCGGSDGGSTGAPLDDSLARGTLVRSPAEHVASWDAPRLVQVLAALARGNDVLSVAGSPLCGIDFHRLEYRTIGARQEAVSTTAVLMVPHGNAASCSGPRPVVLYAHGTSVLRSYDLADVRDAANPAFFESVEVAAIFAAQGYVVVAPNYVGYRGSSSDDHPYLNADQQAADMVDALAAARAALGALPAGSARAGAQLFVAGYSQGGHAAMATHRELQATGQAVTASAPMSGPYALLAFMDQVVLGQVSAGASLFMPLLTRSYQLAYGDLYATAADFYAAPYADGIERLLPGSLGTEELVAQGRLPAALFSDRTPVTGDAAVDAALALPSDPGHGAGFGQPYLVRNEVRVAYARDALAGPDGVNASPPDPAARPAAAVRHPLRAAARRNDLRNWQPAAPVLLCGGRGDPTVFWSNTTAMQKHWSGLPAGRLQVLDLEEAGAAGERYEGPRNGFAAVRRALLDRGGEAGLAENYHVALAPFCTAAARAFFDGLR
jgi:hypothetical protein